MTDMIRRDEALAIKYPAMPSLAAQDEAMFCAGWSEAMKAIAALPAVTVGAELAESRQYALALEEELRVRAEETDQLLLLANSMDADFENYAKAHPASLRVTGPNSDGEYWLHIKADGRSGGINLGGQHGSICKRLLDAVSETGAKK